MKIHKVKSWSHFFEAIKEGRKLHDLRVNDRDYNIGDTVILQKYDIIGGEFTGEELRTEITYITDDRYPCAFSSAILPKDYCILSLKLIRDDH